MRNETTVCQCVKSEFEHLEASSVALPDGTVGFQRTGAELQRTRLQFLDLTH